MNDDRDGSPYCQFSVGKKLQSLMYVYSVNRLLCGMIDESYICRNVEMKRNLLSTFGL